MRYKKAILLPLLAALLLLSACGSQRPAGAAPVDWSAKIRGELLSGESELEQAMAQAVTLTASQADSGQLSVTIQAPDICDALLEWMEALPEEDYSDQALEAEILRLLEVTEPVETSLQMPCSQEEGEALVQYSPEFAELVSCGLTRFYGALLGQVDAALKGDEAA